MLYYLSISEEHTGKFVGACILNRETRLEASHAAAHVAWSAGVRTCVEVAICPVPAGGRPIPADALERFLSMEDLRGIFGELRLVHSSDLKDL